MFSSPSPEYITQSSEHPLLSQLLDEHSNEATSKINGATSASLLPISEPAGKAVGFFEQGLLSGAAIAAVSAITAVGIMIKLLGPAVVRRLA